VLVAFLAFIGLPGIGGAGAQEDPAGRAAREIATARKRANDAADAWAQAQSRFDQLVDAEDRTRREIEELSAEAAGLRATVERIAVNRFVSASTSGLPIVTGFEGPSERAQAGVLIAIITDTSADAFDEYDEVERQLRETEQRLVREQEATRRAQEQLVAARRAAEDEVERLKQVEADRLADEAVRRALEAELAEQRRRDAEQAARAEVFARATRAAQLAPPAPGESAAQAPQVVPGASVTPPSGAGTVGGGGSGAVGGGGGNGVYGSPGWACPIAGPTAFADTWGAPRSSGRRHLGVDMISPRGTPIVAVVAGVATATTNRLGGNAVYLAGSDGHRYYYAHLDSWGTLGTVAAGTVIGYVGDTGNATGTPHLHFEIRPNGGSNVNPYPTVRAFC
jgi:peptidoglycan LD-endopeptidase LytH